MELTLVIGSSVEAIYSDDVVEVLESLGNVSIARASHVEPTGVGSGASWSADLSPVDGPVLGPFARRSEAIDAEISWLQKNRGL